jgi:hypothetical protein
MLLESDCNNNTLRDATGVKRGDTVGVYRRVFETSLVKIITNMLEVKSAIQARETLTRGHVFIE